MTEREQIAKLYKAVGECACPERPMIEDLDRRVSAIERGFPAHHKTGERDPRYHADWHERDIESYEDRKDVTKKLLVAILSAIVIAIGGGVWYLVQVGAKVEMARAAEGKKP